MVVLCFFVAPSFYKLEPDFIGLCAAPSNNNTAYCHTSIDKISSTQTSFIHPNPWLTTNHQHKHKLLTGIIQKAILSHFNSSYRGVRIFRGASWSMNSSSRQQPPSWKHVQLVTSKPCPFAQKCWILLEEMQIPYEFTEISLYGYGGKPAWFLDLNPSGYVPLLVLRNESGGKVVKAVNESTQICYFLLEAYQEHPIASSLMPSSLESMIKTWEEDFIAKRLLPYGKQRIMSGRRGGVRIEDDPLEGCFATLEKQLQEHPYLCGDSYTVGDVLLIPFLQRLEQDGQIDAKTYPSVRQYVERVTRREMVKKTLQRSWWWWW